MKRPEVAEDPVGMVVFLASADSDYVTGQSYHVDGGMVMVYRSGVGYQLAPA